MSDDQPTPDSDGAEQPQAGEQEPTVFDADYVKSLRAEAAKYRTEAKANAEAAKRLAALEESQKTETERLTERLTAAEQRALDAARYEVALEKGLTRSQAKRLVGSTAEELAADADELLADLGKNAPRRPSGDVGQGARTTSTEPDDPASLAAAALAQRGY